MFYPGFFLPEGRKNFPGGEGRSPIFVRAGTGWKMVHRSGPAGKRTGSNHMPNRLNFGKNRRKSNEVFRKQFLEKNETKYEII